MEQESKIPFWKKVKISILGLEEYQKLAAQKISKTIGYMVILMLIFAFFVTLSITYRFHQTLQSVTSYIDEYIESIEFENGNLAIQGKENPIIIEDSELFYGKIIIDTSATQEQIDEYTEEIRTYQNGIVISNDNIIFKTAMSNIPTTISLVDIANQYHIVNLDKQAIMSFLTNNQVYMVYIAFFVAIFIYMFIIYLGTVLIDAILYSLLGHVTALLSGLRLKFTAIYNIAVYSLTLPIILNLIYMVANILTGYTIQYFSIMYMAITCIYVITAILMIRSDVIKKQIELSKIIEEQEKVRQEIARREQEKKEEEERERIRKEDEKKRQEEKKNKEEKEKKNSKGKKKENPSEKEEKPKKEGKRKPNSQGPEPQANIKPSNS